MTRRTMTRTKEKEKEKEKEARSLCYCHDAGVKKGPWTEKEDRTLVEHIQRHGGHVSSWRNLPKAAGLNRCGKSCRLRWANYLHPDIKRGNFTADEESLIISLHAQLGNKWSKIARLLDGRTDNEIKNYRNTHIRRKKLLRMGIDPVTHQRVPPDDSSPGAAGAILSAAASLGGLNTALMQVQALQLLLQAVNGGGRGGSAAAAENAIPNASRGSSGPSLLLQDQMNLPVSHANYASPDLSNIVASFAEQQQQQHDVAYAEPLAVAALVSAAYPQELASAAADRPVQGSAELLSEPIEMPSICSLEDDDEDAFWKEMLLESSGFSLPL